MNVKWWESHNGKYSGVWKEWLDEQQQQYDGSVHGGDAIIERNMITMIGVKFTQAARNAYAAGGWKLTEVSSDQIQNREVCFCLLSNNAQESQVG